MTKFSTRSPRGARALPSLDGLRAISIALVLLSHYAGTRDALVPIGIHALADWGVLGVRVFFVISGFLITTLLLTEADRTGTIALRSFYWRRTMRIFPAYYAYLACMALAAAAGLIIIPDGAMVRAVAYVSNYGPSMEWNLGHSWSLSVEEQFYLLWPAALLLAGRRRAWMVAVAVILLAPVIRVAEYHLMPGTEIDHRFETTADALAMGCLLAYARPWLGANLAYARVRTSGLLYLLPLVAIAGASLGHHPHLAYVVGDPLTNLSIALLVDWTVRDASTPLGRVLNWAPLALVGRMSYSLYLWQQPFLHRDTPGWATRSPLNLVLAICAAVLSYLLVEQPAMRLRQRLSAPRNAAPVAQSKAA